ncbi:MAG TPA: hypothetical protein VLS28_08385 [Candidatus Sulfomarinibacteraceae bacterium]|nr:hypothetical protein [Candidatus Sulfomarinibacteraceae bacterium]
MRRGLAAAFGLALVVVAGCGGVTAPTQAPTPQRPALPAGTYTANAFVPRITYTLPDGWLVVGDSRDELVLQPVTSDVSGIWVFRSPLPASQDSDCPIAPAPGVGPTAKDLVDWIRARPGFTTSDPVVVTLGGLVGLQVDIAIVAGWAPSCPFAEGLPTVPLFVSATDSSFRWVVAGSERLRLLALDVPGEGTVVVDVDAFDGSLMDGLLAAATPIVESMRFALP